MHTKKKYIIGNHKNNSPQKLLMTELGRCCFNKSRVIICPTLISLHEFTVPKLISSKIKLGVQTITPIKTERVTCTGETSIKKLKELNVEYVIIGHNERRTVLNESTEILEKQIVTCKENGFVPIFCVGQQSNESREVLLKQLEVYKKYYLEFSERIIAYEPAFAIGTGKTPSISEIKQSIEYLRVSLDGVSVSILYGGSVGLKNSKEIVGVCDGLLIGGASLSEEFFDIAKEIENCS